MGDKSSKISEENIPLNRMEFIEGFQWAIPQAFSDAIAHSQFEEGDIFYDSKKAYEQWSNALHAIKFSIQIKSPPEFKLNIGEDETISIFKKNWTAKIKIDITNYKERFQKKRISTTQGRLFTFLRYGDFGVLDIKADEPELPILVDEARRFLISSISHHYKKSEEEAIEYQDDTILEHFKRLISDKIEKPNMFIMIYDSTNNTTAFKFREIYNSLSSNFSVDVYELMPAELSLPNFDKLFPTITFKCIAIDSGKSEMIRDFIKEVLWPKKDQQKATKTVQNILTRNRSSSANPFRLSRHGIFYSYKDEQLHNNKIKTHSFKRRDTFFIRYRLSLNNPPLPKSIEAYLNLLFTDCPNHLFLESDFHVSGITTEIDVPLIHNTEHELINIAKESRSFNPCNSRHENLEKYMLENDFNTIACEIPLWIESGEFKDYYNVFKTYKALTGHIDILRYEKNGKISVWDYKPKAYKEKKAITQVFLYAFMLSVRTGRTLDEFICGYFDEVDAYYFNPSEVKSFEL